MASFTLSEEVLLTVTYTPVAVEVEKPPAVTVTV